MTLGELTKSLRNRKQGLAYKVWKQAYLIVLGTSDLLRDKKSKAMFPKTPEEGSPELFPPKATIKRPSFLRKEWSDKWKK